MAEVAAVVPPFSAISGAAALEAEPEWLRDAADRRGWAWARIAWRRAAAVDGAWFDAAKAEAVVRLWPKVFRMTQDRFAGLPFRLSAWEEIIVRLLVGWKAPAEITDAVTGLPVTMHLRLFRRLMLWIPRKGGKSEFLAALAILFFAIEGVYAGEGFAFARDEKQALIVFNRMKRMLALSPRFKGKVQSYKKSIWIPQIEALFELLPGKPDGKHGRAPTVIVGDEMHEWVTGELASNLRQGTGNRLEPIELYASTAGLKTNLVGYGLWQESQKILAGEIDEPTTLVVIFAAEPDADWTDEAVWALANPTLGLSPTKQFLQREAALARHNPRAEANFRRYHLNQWVEAVVRWLNMQRWAACAKEADWNTKAARLAGRECFAAFDISATQDVTALSLVFPPEAPGGVFDLLCRFWVPEETKARRVLEAGVPYDRFFAAGALETTPGDYVDQDYMKLGLEQAMTQFKLQRIGFDPWNASKLVTDMQKAGADPDLFVAMRQGIPTLGEPTKQVERLVYAGLLGHGGHPVLAWMAANTVVRFDENMNFAPAKKKSAEKIDGIVATVMAVGLAIAAAANDDTPSYLETDDVMFL